MRRYINFIPGNATGTPDKKIHEDLLRSLKEDEWLEWQGGSWIQKLFRRLKRPN